MENRIYLDHAATSPIHPEVIQEMLGCITNSYGNPSSIHSAGRSARKTLDSAREKLAELIHADEKEIVFTSGGTEGDNTAVIGTALKKADQGKHIITTQIEHPAVLKSCAYLETKGFEVTYLAVDDHGVIRLDEFKKALREDTILVSVMYGNNEVGSIQPIAEIGSLLEQHSATFHTDAVQAFGLIQIDVKQLGVDLLTTSSHKINGPRGVGLLYVKDGTELEFPFHGGEQERKRRPGTENLAGICGFKKAAEIMTLERLEKIDDYNEYKKCMIQKFEDAGLNFEINGALKTTLPHIFSIRFHGVSVEQLLMNLDMEGIFVSSGSACTAGTVDPSHVLTALFGENAPAVKETVRISFGLGNTFDEIEEVAEKMITIVKRLAK
ncbi:cysteine desulfurase family protein [Listeria sp. PSOL-1]|uniref:cysteine desulfurase family protein n=1 Tax=Listeria sp. PSOL-1 TaxID=1844999 RepID=UPI0013D1C9F7|nr:cysteine desulfurase family protein [Listeria sp. PSOL-1]